MWICPTLFVQFGLWRVVLGLAMVKSHPAAQHTLHRTNPWSQAPAPRCAAHVGGAVGDLPGLCGTEMEGDISTASRAVLGSQGGDWDNA